jgi:hypothetical protein
MSFYNILHSPFLIPVCWPLHKLWTLKTGIVLVMILDIYCNTTVKGCRNSMGNHFFCILILHPLLSFIQYLSCGSYSTETVQLHVIEVFCNQNNPTENYFLGHYTEHYAMQHHYWEIFISAISLLIHMTQHSLWYPSSCK